MSIDEFPNESNKIITNGKFSLQKREHLYNSLGLKQSLKQALKQFR